MGDLPKPGLDALTRAQARYSPQELLISYARGRVAHVWTRQAMTALGVFVLWVTNGPLYAIAALVLSVLGETVDCAYLRHIARTLRGSAHVRRAYILSTLTGAFQALTIACCVALGWFGPVSHSAPLFALSFLLGTAINAGLVLPYHRASALARLVIYAATLIILLGSEVAVYGGVTQTFALNVGGATMLIYMATAFLVFVNTGFERNRKRTLDMTRRGIELAEVNARLTKREAELIAARQASEHNARAKADFLATMSHEIRTPMNGIMGMADLLADSDLTADQRLYADTIRGSAQGLLNIINDILDLSKLDAGKMSLMPVDFDLKACLASTVQLLRPQATEKGIDLRLTIAGTVPDRVHGDDARLRQILLNLIGNAVKFTDQGHVTVTASVAQTGTDLDLTVAVQDTGIGIAADKLDHVFERFSQAEASTTRRFGGTGLGLTISRLLASAMGGDITVRSDAGAGAEFTLKLRLRPASSQTDMRDPPDHQALVAGTTGLRVLVAEDNHVNRVLMQKYLADADISLSFATNGAEAVSLTRQIRPDVIFMDMSMPVMDGLEATRQIRKTCDHHPRIIALTANAFASDRDACLAAGMDGFLSKPVRRYDVLTHLARHQPACSD